MAFQRLTINSDVWYYENPNYVMVRSTVRGMKQQHNVNGAEVVPFEVNVDYGYDFDEQELRKYFLRMKQLSNQGPFIRIHCYEFNSNTKIGYIVLDKYRISLEDLLMMPNGPDSLFIQNPISKKFNFPLRFQKILRIIIEGIKIILSGNLDYPYLSTKSIVFLVGDDNFEQPKLVDMYAGAEPSSIWSNLADVIRTVICYFQAARGITCMTSEDINQFLSVLDTFPMNAEGKIIQHPALLFPGEKLEKVVHINDNDPNNEVSMINEKYFRGEVSNNVTWQHTLTTDPYWKTICVRKNTYSVKAEGLVRLIRNVDKHLIHNIKSFPHPQHPNLKQLSKEEMEELFESYFPRLMSYLFDSLSDQLWMKKQ